VTKTAPCKKAQGGRQLGRDRIGGLAEYSDLASRAPNPKEEKRWEGEAKRHEEGAEKRRVTKNKHF